MTGARGLTSEFVSIIIDPAQFLDKLQSSFVSTMAILRDPAQTEMGENFTFCDLRVTRPGPIPLTDDMRASAGTQNRP